METESIPIKQKSVELSGLTGRLIGLLELARRQARGRDGEEWADQAIKNIAGYHAKLDTALRAHDPKGLSYAAGDLSVVGRYVNDYDYSWFGGNKELASVIAAVHKAAAGIVASIKTTDPANLERVRRELA
jgi:hypothetical protein